MLPFPLTVARRAWAGIATQAPDDLEQVRFAFRLGWALAELRGSYRPDRFDHPVPPGEQGDFKRPLHELPLANERSAYEVRIEVQKTTEDLNAALQLQSRHQRSVRALLDKMNAKGADRVSLWPGLADGFYNWDADLQDALVLHAPQAAAYQLGRGLAETYWALYPDRPRDQMGSWSLLLGPQRCRTIRRLAARLAPYLDPLISPAIEGPLVDWAALATRQTPPADDETLLRRYRQGLLWRELVRGERMAEDLPVDRDPSTPTPKDREVWDKLGIYREAALTLMWPLLGGLVASVLLVSGAALLASGTSYPGLSTALAILGALGLTTASLYARAKAELVALFARLSREVIAEKVRRAANLCPRSD